LDDKEQGIERNYRYGVKRLNKPLMKQKEEYERWIHTKQIENNTKYKKSRTIVKNKKMQNRNTQR
jgi:hypothetical protein